MSNMARVLVLAAVFCALFGVTVIVLLRIMPGPLKETDYLIIGCSATLVSLLVLFFLLVFTWIKDPNAFFKRRRRT
jgi:hypothetical protein